MVQVGCITRPQGKNRFPKCIFQTSETTRPKLSFHIWYVWHGTQFSRCHINLGGSNDKEDICSMQVACMWLMVYWSYTGVPEGVYTRNLYRLRVLIERNLVDGILNFLVFSMWYKSFIIKSIWILNAFAACGSWCANHMQVCSENVTGTGLFSAQDCIYIWKAILLEPH